MQSLFCVLQLRQCCFRDKETADESERMIEEEVTGRK